MNAKKSLPPKGKKPSLDDNEQHRLRMMMDEMFGDENFVTNIVVIRAEGGGMAKQAIREQSL